MISKKSLPQALLSVALSVMAMSLILVISAGTFSFIGGWLCLSCTSVYVVSFFIWLLFRYPEQLQNRLSSEENRHNQKRIVAIAIMVCCLSLCVAGLDFRFNYSAVNELRYIPASLFLIGACFIHKNVFSDNPYLFATVEAKEGQRVIGHGIYGIVRHPMYLGSLFLFISQMIVLGSLWNVATILIMLWVIKKRIADEEAFMLAVFPEYHEYQDRVPYKLIPKVW